MSKPYPRMQCAVCKRPMAKAAALLGGLPVGPVCAEKNGLFPFSNRPAVGKRAKAPDPTAVVRDTQAIDLFGGV